MNQNPRLEITDTVPELLQKMAEGYPGALVVCLSLIKQGGKIDPLSAFGGLMNIMALDDLEIYASDIWVLAKYVCHARTDNVVLLLRGRQLGIISGPDIKNAIKSRKGDFDFEDLACQVKAEIGEFNWPYEE